MRCWKIKNKYSGRYLTDNNNNFLQFGCKYYAHLYIQFNNYNEDVFEVEPGGDDITGDIRGVSIKQYRTCKKIVDAVGIKLSRIKRCIGEKKYQIAMEDSESDVYQLARCKKIYEGIIMQIDKTVGNIDNLIVRRAIILKYMSGFKSPSWQEIANIIGDVTAEDVEKKVWKAIADAKL